MSIMDKSKILNIVLATALLLVLFLKRGDNSSPANNVVTFFNKNSSKDTAIMVRPKRSLGVKNLVYPEPAMVIGSYDKDGKPNIMTAAWFGVANSRPFKVAVSLRPATYSYHGIMANGAFTVNVPDASLVSFVKFAGKYSGKDMNKFEETGLTAIKAEYVNAPYVGEFPIVMECKLTSYHDLGSHRQFIGEVVDTKIDQRLLTADGHLNMELFKPIIYGQGKYYSGLEQITDIVELFPQNTK
jgi:flavin reductase (DIM6/NTAB) family NADH-FMN oxidoreductase RutF